MNASPDQPFPDPLAELGAWFDDAQARCVQRHPNAMTLATVNAEARPSARVVLIKDLSRANGHLTFYTHYESRKALDLSTNSYAAGVLHWDALGRQIRFEGPVVRAPDEESDAYFAGRPAGSQINAWVSAQSRELDSLADLERRALDRARDFGLTSMPASDGESGDASIPRPPFWGGYRFWFAAIEFWQEGTNRFHSRTRYERMVTPEDSYVFSCGPWSSTRLQP